MTSLPDIVLLKLPGDGPEEFVMIARGELFPGLTPGQPASREQWMDQFARLLHQPRLTESGVRDAEGKHVARVTQTQAVI